MRTQQNDEAKECVLDGKPTTHFQENYQHSNGVIAKDLTVSLEDLLKPCQKEATIERINGNNEKEQKTFIIELIAGTKEETPITFTGEGNRDSAGNQGDVIFTVKYEKHVHFTVLDGVHLQYIAEISPEESLQGCLLSVPTLDGEPICLIIEESIPDQSEERILSRGLPLNVNSPKRGDLIIRFEVQGKSIETKDEKDSPDYQVEIQNTDENTNYLRTNSNLNALKHAHIELELEVTLEEIFSGCKRNLKFTRWVIGKNGMQIKEEKVLNVEVERGMASHSQKTFPNEGDHLQGYLPGDVICTFVEKPHSVFQRKGDNLLYSAMVTQHQFVNCSKIEIPTLDGHRAFLDLGKVKGIGQLTLLMGRGLPNFHEPSTRGDIGVKVDIQSEQTIPKRVKRVRSKTAKFNLEQDPLLQKTIALPLEDFIQGCTRKYSNKRMIIDPSTKKSNFEISKFQIEIEANSCIEQEKVIPQIGDQHEGRIAADLHVILTDMPHPLFSRTENDLHFSIKLSENEERRGLLVPIPALLKPFQIHTKRYNLKEVIPFANERMPDKTGKRGFIYVHFNVISDKYKDKTIVHEVPFNWIEFIKGAVKRYDIKQLTTEPNGPRTEIIHPIELNLRPGIQTGTTFVYSRLGEIHKRKLAADVTFKVTEKDAEFVRHYTNLQWQINVPSDKFQVGKQIEVRTSICCEHLQITQKMIEDNWFWLKGFGLPYPNNPIKRGDLIVHMDKMHFDLINQPNEDQPFTSPTGPDSPKLETEIVTLTLEQILIVHSISAYQLTAHNQTQLQFTPLTILKGLIDGSAFVKRFNGKSVTFQIKAKEHLTFQTQGHNLLYTKNVSLIEALCGCALEIPLLGNEKPHTIDIQDIIHPNFEYRILEQGLLSLYKEKQENVSMELVHADIWEAKERGFDGSRYFLIIIDQYSKYVEVFLLQHKSSSAALEVFAKYQVKMERLLGQKIMRFRTDNGREFLADFTRHLDEQGIQHQLTVPHCHQQNGNAERAIQSISVKTRCLLYEGKMPSRYWPLAVKTTAILYNLLPHSAVEEKSPFKILFPDVKSFPERGGKFHVFGSLAYRWIHPERRNYLRAAKFEPISEKFVFVGYDDIESDTLLLLNKRNGKGARERNVTVVDGLFPFDKEKATPMRILEQASSPAIDLPEIFHLAENELDDDDCQEGDFVPKQPESTSPEGDGEHESRDEEDSRQMDETASTNQFSENTEETSSDDDESSHSESSESAPEEEAEQQPQEEPILRLRDRTVDRRPDMYGFGRIGNPHPSALSARSTSNPAPIPSTYTEAMESNHAHEWRQAILEEHGQFVACDVFTVVDHDPCMKLVTTRFVFDLKLLPSGLINRFKTRPVARGFNQELGRDYWETFEPTVNNTPAIRLFITLSKVNKWIINQLDVKTAFLNADIDVEICVNPPEPFKTSGNVWKLKKAIYGLKQASRCWSEKFNEIMASMDFFQTKSEQGTFVIRSGNRAIAYLVVFVDDILVSTEEAKDMQAIKDQIQQRVQEVVKDGGTIGRFLAVDCVDMANCVFAWQSRYSEELSTRFRISTASDIRKLPPMDTVNLKTEKPDDYFPIQEIIGARLYISGNTRPDVASAVSYLSRYVDRPNQTVWKYCKMVLNYLKSTKEMKLVLRQQDESGLVTYSNANFAPIGVRKSQSGALFKFAGSTIGWHSRKQKTVSTSTTDAEYVALSAATSETFWLQNLLEEMSYAVNYPTTILEDNQPAIAIASNQKGKSLAKHIDIKLHAIQDYQRMGRISVKYINTKDQLADGLTKVMACIPESERLLGPQPSLESGQPEGVLRSKVDEASSDSTTSVFTTGACTSSTRDAT